MILKTKPTIPLIMEKILPMIRPTTFMVCRANQENNSFIKASAYPTAMMISTMITAVGINIFLSL